MATRWPLCVPPPYPFETKPVPSLAAFPDDPQILRAAIFRLAKFRAMISNELSQGVHANRGTVHERASWRLLVNKQTTICDETTNDSDEKNLGDQTPVPPSDSNRSQKQKRTSHSTEPYARLPSSQLKGVYSLNPSSELRAAIEVRDAETLATEPPSVGEKTQRLSVQPTSEESLEDALVKPLSPDVTSLPAPHSNNSKITQQTETCVFRCAKLPGAVHDVFFLASEGVSNEKIALVTSNDASLEVSFVDVATENFSVKNFKSCKVAKRLNTDTAPLVFSVDNVTYFARSMGDVSGGIRSDGGVRVMKLNESNYSGVTQTNQDSFDIACDLACNFPVTKLALSGDGIWLVGAGAKGAMHAWYVNEVLHGTREYHVGVTLKTARYGGVAPSADAPTVLRFSDDGNVLTAVFDETIFATYTVPKCEKIPGCAGIQNNWELRGVSYSTKERVHSMRVFSEEAKNENSEESDKNSNGFRFENAQRGATPSVLVALASKKPEGYTQVSSLNGVKPRVVVGVLDHTAQRGEAHRGLVLCDAVSFGENTTNDKNTFVPVALAGTAGGYAVVVGERGETYVWDVGTGDTLGRWQIGNEEVGASLNNYTTRVAAVVENDSILAVVARSCADKQDSETTTSFEVHRVSMRGKGDNAEDTLSVDDTAQRKRRRTR